MYQTLRETEMVRGTIRLKYIYLDSQLIRELYMSYGDLWPGEVAFLGINFSVPTKSISINCIAFYKIKLVL